MKIIMIEDEIDEPLLEHTKFDIAFHGKIHDDRGENVIDYIKNKSNILVCIEYDAHNKVFIIGDERTEIIIDEFYTFFDKEYKNKSIILETTTLGFPELLVITKCAKQSRITDFYLIYWEPANYRRQSGENILHKRDFELSGEMIGYKAIPGFAPLLLDDPEFTTKSVFCLGFEASRLDRAFEDNQMINSKDCTLIFGVPAFNPGWEMNSYANNLRVIQERNLLGPHSYCAASNPLAIYSYLGKLKASLNIEESMIIVPIGTKPSGIGAALFLVECPEVGVLYDHPVKEKGRSVELGKKHTYIINFNE